MLDNLVFISAAPVDFYFTWQYEVFITNAREHGISDKIQICIWYPESRKEELKEWDRLQKKYPEVKWFYYLDHGVNLGLYISQLRPHILKQHFEKYRGALKDKVFFYHDSDIIFNRLPDFPSLIEDDICWQSSCTDYLDYSYMRRKEKQGSMPDEEGVELMAKIGKISPDVIKFYDGRTGGAQVILKGIDAEFWEDVERMCIEIRQAFSHHVPGSINQKYFTTESEGWQSWCADMWALNFALWNRGIPTDVSSELEFSWATDSLETYNKKPIMHNAGVTGSKSGLFFKADWMKKSPISHKLKLPAENTASRKYVEAIKAVK